MAVSLFEKQVLAPFRAYVNNNSGLILDIDNNVSILEVIPEDNKQKVDSCIKVDIFVLESQFTSRNPGTLGQRLVNASREETTEFYNLALKLTKQWGAKRKPWTFAYIMGADWEAENVRQQLVYASCITWSAREEVVRKGKAVYQLPAHIRAQREVEMQPVTR